MASLFVWLRRLRAVVERFRIHPEMDSPERILEAISRDVTFRGINLWVLITATLVASVGLNVNSTAVIIGAMLISPLMGPIIGVGVSLAIYDIALFRKSLRNLVVAVFFSLVASSLYFLLTPLKEAGSELIARTKPTFWDVLIAFFGGLSGVIAALGREKKTNIIAGVAIATALMPPLCTAGYGVGTGQWSFFIGAFYLFLINAVFISASAYLTFQVIRFPNREFVDKSYQQRIRRLLAVVGLLTLLPSVYIAYTVVQEAIQEARVRQFVEKAFEVFPLTSVVEYKKISEGDTVRLRVVLVGEPLAEKDIQYLAHELHTSYRLPKYRLEVVQGILPEKPEPSHLLELAERSHQQVRTLSDSVYKLQRALEACRKEKETQTQELLQIAREARSLFPEIQRLGFQKMRLSDGKSYSGDTVYAVWVEVPSKRKFAEGERLQKWLSERLGGKKVQVFLQPTR